MRTLKNLSSSQKFIEILLSLFVALLVVLPHVWAYARTPEGFFFTGANTVANLGDILGVYFPAIRNFAEGDFLYRNSYDPNLPPFFHYPVYLILGKLVAMTSVSVVFVYHAAAFLITFIFLLFIFRFLNFFFRNFKLRIFAFGLVCFGGFFTLTIQEAFGISSFSSPHFLVAQFGLFLSFFFLVLITKSKKVPAKTYGLLLISALLVSAIHPWMVLILVIFNLASFVYAYLFFNKQRSFRLIFTTAIFCAVSLPFLMYFGNPERIPWISFVLPTGALLPFLLYGLSFPLAILGIVIIPKKHLGLPYIFISIWFLIQIIFTYLPFSFQRRFIEGFYLPTAICAVVGIDWLNKKFRTTWSATRLYWFWFIFLSLGAFAGYGFMFFWLPNDLVYKPLEIRESARVLQSERPGTRKVLTLPSTGILLVSQADVEVLAGHVMQTPDFYKKEELIKSYYGGIFTPEERRNFILSQNICYVYVGPNEQKLTPLNFKNEDYLENNKIYEKKSVSIYKVKWCKY